MQADIRWLDDPRVFRVGQVEAHSDHVHYGCERDYAKGQSTLTQSLDGVWKFRYSVNAASRPADFYREGYDVTGFDEINVPGHIEIAGYDRIHYINTMYPWEGHLFRRPPFTGMKGAQMEGMFSGAAYNPVGSYVRTFDLDEPQRGKRVILRFEGVEQAMYVWLNGQFLGYAEDSFSMSEFDATPFVRERGNVLAVEVHKRSSAAFLEDQDFFRFFGIFRSVSLIALPDAHVQDLWVQPQVDVGTRKGHVRVRLKLSGPMREGRVQLTLRDGERVLADVSRAIAPETDDTLEIPGEVKLWDHQNPTLYTLEVRLYDSNGTLCEIVPQALGFRKIELREKVMMLNGRRLILNGVNRHEWNAHSGRCITDEDERQDIEIMLRNHINAVRTSHYPNRLSFYSLCDRHGLYMMAETNLESHGSWQKMSRVEPSYNVPGSLPEWEGAVLDRAKNNFETFKNHPSVLFWSLGNESYAGEALVKMNAYFKERDPDRLVHYEGVFRAPAYKDRISDMESHMYSTPQTVRAYLESDPPKPFILCEYMHDMGNSLGGLGSYMDLLREYPLYQGGFIWDFIDQALFVRDEVTGRDVLRYGGDFDDRPSDYEFSGNGIVFADRTEKPAMQEVRYYYGLYD